MLVGAWMEGCVGTPGVVSSPPPHEHIHKAPHGGRLVEVGEEFAHLELLWDADKASLTVYVLDGECETPVRLGQAELQLQGMDWSGSLRGVANSLSEEKVGDTSQFGGSLPGLRGHSEWSGEIRSLTVNSQTFEHLRIAYP